LISFSVKTFVSLLRNKELKQNKGISQEILKAFVHPLLQNGTWHISLRIGGYQGL